MLLETSQNMKDKNFNCEGSATQICHFHLSICHPFSPFIFIPTPIFLSFLLVRKFSYCFLFPLFLTYFFLFLPHSFSRFLFRSFFYLFLAPEQKRQLGFSYFGRKFELPTPRSIVYMKHFDIPPNVVNGLVYCVGR